MCVYVCVSMCVYVCVVSPRYAGALDLLNRIVDEFPKFEGLARVLQIRASLWVRLGRAEEAIKCRRCVCRPALRVCCD
jgi:hypothetical protein